MSSVKNNKIDTKKERLNIRLTKEEKLKLDALCNYHNLNMSNILVSLITSHHVKIFKA